MAAVGASHEGRSPAARVVAGAGALDLDHVGAEIGQDLPRPGAGENAGEFEHAYSGQGTRHRLILLRVIGGLLRQKQSLLWPADAPLVQYAEMAGVGMNCEFVAPTLSNQRMRQIRATP